jgi:hypothetical protein
MAAFANTGGSSCHAWPRTWQTGKLGHASAVKPRQDGQCPSWNSPPMCYVLGGLKGAPPVLVGAAKSPAH